MKGVYNVIFFSGVFLILSIAFTIICVISVIESDSELWVLGLFLSIACIISSSFALEKSTNNKEYIIKTFRKQVYKASEYLSEEELIEIIKDVKE